MWITHLQLYVVVLRPLEHILCLLEPFAELRRVLSRAQLAVVGFKYGAHSITLLQQTHKDLNQGPLTLTAHDGRNHKHRCSKLLSAAGLSFCRTAMFQRNSNVSSNEKHSRKQMHFIHPQSDKRSSGLCLFTFLLIC